jgi:hypothetical protein
MSLRYGKSTGFIETITPNGTIRRDTFKCQHCQFIVSFEPFCDPADVGGHCKLCDDLICSNCVRRNVCITVEEMLQHMEGGWIDRAKLAEWESIPIIAIGT